MKDKTSTSFMSLSSSRLKADLLYVGITLGILLMIIALSLDLYYGKVAFNWRVIVGLYKSNPVHWVISTSPFFLGTLFFIMGKMISERETKLEERTRRDTRQYQLLEQFINNFENETADEHLAEFDNKIIAEKLSGFKSKLQRGKLEERIRNWESEGLAQFADILRRQQNVNALAEDVLRFLVKYLNANQGSVFILSNESPGDQVLELKACYAYDRKKFLNASVPVGQGLVGQCFLERETIILYDVPKDYIKITSGLGMATPSFVAIVPIKTEDAVTGILEIAAFHRMAAHEVRLLERACQAFASVISNVVTGQNVSRLLQESQQQTEELRSQDEELRQNLEELETIQEQMSRQLEENQLIKNDLEQREHVLAKTTILSESDLYGTITYANEKFCEVSQYSREELMGQPHNIVRHPDMPKEVFKLMWSTIKRGDTFRGIVKNRKKDGSHYWVDATIVPIVEEGRITKYIGARYHIQDDVMAEKLYHQQLVRLGLAVTEDPDLRLVTKLKDAGLMETA